MRYSKSTKIALAALVLGMSSVTFAAAEAADTGLLPYRDADVVAQGAELYQSYCASCHGAELEGEPNWRVRGEDGLLPAPPHDETGHTWHHPDAQLIALTQYGVAALVGNGYQSAMIGFGDVLTEAEIIATLADIKSTWPDEVIEIHNQINASRQ
jgi:mono/diheme cytochrome c family protein